MDKNTNNRQNIWEIIYKWEDIDHLIPQRDKKRYIYASFFILFIIIWWIIDWSYSMSFVFLLIFFTYIYTSSQKAYLQKNIITDLWIKIWEKFIFYTEIKSFWFINFNNWNLLYLKTNFSIHPIVIIPVIDWDFSIVKNLFLEFWVDEIEWKKESIDQIIARKLKL